MTNTQFIFGVSDFMTTEPLLNAEAIVKNGMDFIEPALGKVALMPELDFRAVADRLKTNRIRVQSMNWFLPPGLKVTGPETDDIKSRDFLTLALSRAETMEAKAVIFGSPGSRSIPDGFSPDKAHEQMVGFCHLCADIIRQSEFGMRIAVEPVNHTETNFINTFAQALALVREVDRPEIGLAADFYHFAMENEPTDIIREAGDLICAVQLADPRGRTFPKLDANIPGLIQFFDHLAAINYTGGISIEATPGDNLAADCRAAAEAMRSITKGIQK
jgi:D-psicose/D-tagatose/L-ribulose 3-epimerase